MVDGKTIMTISGVILGFIESGLVGAVKPLIDSYAGKLAENTEKKKIFENCLNEAFGKCSDRELRAVKDAAQKALNAKGPGGLIADLSEALEKVEFSFDRLNKEFAIIQFFDKLAAKDGDFKEAFDEFTKEMRKQFMIDKNYGENSDEGLVFESDFPRYPQSQCTQVFFELNKRISQKDFERMCKAFEDGDFNEKECYGCQAPQGCPPAQMWSVILNIFVVNFDQSYSDGTASFEEVTTMLKPRLREWLHRLDADLGIKECFVFPECIVGEDGFNDIGDYDEDEED